MSACTHDFPERETAVADGYCPLCLAAGVTRLRAEVERLTKERDEACRYILDLTQGNIGCGDNPVRFLVASHAAILRERDEARAERDRLRADMATVSERTLVKGCCGHEWKEYAGTCPECRAAAEAAVERLMKERDAERDARVYLSKRVSAAESERDAAREALRLAEAKGAALMARGFEEGVKLHDARRLLAECADSMEARPEDPGLQVTAKAVRRALGEEGGGT